MANPDTNKTKGFSPQAPICPPRKHFVDASNSTAFFKGDMVSSDADGRAKPAAAGDIDLIGATDDYLAASTAGTVMVYSDPDQQYLAQDNGGGTVSIDNVGNMCDHEANAGNATLLFSNHELDFSTLTAGTSAAGFFVLAAVQNQEFSEDSAEEPDTDNQAWICMCNEHIYKSTVTDTEP